VFKPETQLLENQCGGESRARPNPSARGVWQAVPCARNCACGVAVRVRKQARSSPFSSFLFFSSSFSFFLTRVPAWSSTHGS